MKNVWDIITWEPTWEPTEKHIKESMAPNAFLETKNKKR